jgi:aerobic carbon-monoxide dehydrogenase large subunit
MDYLLPSSLDVPPMQIEYIETEFADNPIGAKGVGESGTCFAPAAVITAVGDALGVEINHFGVSPRNVYELLVQAGIV